MSSFEDLIQQTRASVNYEALKQELVYILADPRNHYSMSTRLQPFLSHLQGTSQENLSVLVSNLQNGIQNEILLGALVHNVVNASIRDHKLCQALLAAVGH